MKPSRFSPALTLALLLPYAQAASLRLIYDGSLQPEQPKVGTAERRLLLDTYLARRRTVCPDFEVLRRATGRFTTQATETLYLIQNCYNDFAANPMRDRYRGDLLVLRGNRATYYAKSFADDITALPPVGTNSLNTLVRHIWFGPHMGEFTRNSSLLRLAGGRVKLLTPLGPTYREYEPYQQPAMVSVRTLWVSPNDHNQLIIREYTSPYCDTCRNPERPYDPRRAKLSLALGIDLRYPPNALY
ncbi:hypothetical protein HNR42_001048 [Deinobacterium chartae]|uniref:Uncharacterized protein n=1 Tax=Deinobacterium chartae TaxID=521158 RepID=A0A841HVU0_9DEIO|nr:hypothetical protein [Deinobacterium chartae]MBB6097631.1 hypothetical protein [Deinobacterium chartae]